MKHVKPICRILLLAIVMMAMNSSLAANLPKMNNKFVTDAAGTLSSAELNQLREDVKAMCDYYSTQIVVAIVPSFGGLSIDEYAVKLSDQWNVAKEDGMLILVKPKSKQESGEAMLLASPDLEDVFSNSVCEEIVHENMIPHFKENDYFGGIEAVLEYMNNMSEDDGSSNHEASQSYDYDTNEYTRDNSDGKSILETILGGLKLILIILGIIIGVGLLVYIVLKLKNPKKAPVKKQSSIQKLSNSSKQTVNKLKTIIRDELEEDNEVDNDDDVDDGTAATQAQIEERKRQLQMKKKQEEKMRELERLERELNSEDDYEDNYSDNLSWGHSANDLGTSMGLVNSLNSIAGSGIGGGGLLKKAAVGAAVVGGTALVLKNKDKIAGTVKSMIGGNNSSSNSSNSNSSSTNSDKPKLGGSGGSNSSKPKLGGGNSNNNSKPKLGGGGKPKLGGGSSSGSW